MGLEYRLCGSGMTAMVSDLSVVHSTFRKFRPFVDVDTK
jgi:hypothetical protein